MSASSISSPLTRSQIGLCAFFAVPLCCGGLQTPPGQRQPQLIVKPEAVFDENKPTSGSDVDKYEFEYDLGDLPFETDIFDIVQEKLALADGNGTDASLPYEKKISNTWPFNRRTPVAKMPAEFEIVPRERPLMWVHIHKAGGTFMCAMAQLAGEKVTEPSDGSCNWLWHDQYRDSGEKETVSCEDRIAFFRNPSRNFTWSQLEREFASADRCWDDFDYGVMLREPIALLESEVNYHPGCWFLGQPCGGGPQDPAKFLRKFEATLAEPPEPPGLDQFPMWKYFDNIQVRLLAPALDVSAGQLNETHLQAAKDSLEKFKVVVRLEDFPTQGAKVFEKLGWHPYMMSHVGEPVNENVKGHNYRFSEDEAKWLRYVNRYDLELWESFKP